jgi:hypothetical protein
MKKKVNYHSVFANIFVVAPPLTQFTKPAISCSTFVISNGLSFHSPTLGGVGEAVAAVQVCDATGVS